MSDYLLEDQALPRFNSIKIDDIVPALDKILAASRAAIARLTSSGVAPCWETILAPIEELDDQIQKFWSPINHLHSVADNPELREIYTDCVQKLTAYRAEMGQNAELFKAYQAVASKDGADHDLSRAQRKVIEHALRDLRLSGVDLPAPERARFKALKEEQARLSTQFEENLLDATRGWSCHFEDPARLAGLPDLALAGASERAEQAGKKGWLFNLEFPSYMPVITYADDRDLRFEMYRAFVTRASDEGPNAGRWDNSALMTRIMEIRQELSQLLGFPHYAAYSLATKMAGSPREVLDFLNDLAARARSMAELELAELRDLAKGDLKAWDIAYFAEKLRKQRYDIDQESLRPYFPVPKVLDGLFAVVRRLFGISVRERQEIDRWDPMVRFYELHDAAGNLRGMFYLDLYARANKRGGAWMDECRVRKVTAGVAQHPVAYLTCNFTPPVGADPALLTHQEVVTLFHEFGHGLHHMLTLVERPAVAGINGVAWDAVELPSQLLENWCWEREALALISGHYRSGEPMDTVMFEKLHAAKNFHAGMTLLRQLEFALFDFRLHMEYQPGVSIQGLLDEVRSAVAVIQPPAFNRFAHGFAHIFAGGYAAGYYSYKWAEVLSADVFSKFKERGVFDQQTGLEFMHSILEQGGTDEPMSLFRNFRGREPSIEPLLLHTGIVTGGNGG